MARETVGLKESDLPEQIQGIASTKLLFEKETEQPLLQKKKKKKHKKKKFDSKKKKKAKKKDKKKKNKKDKKKRVKEVQINSERFDTSGRDYNAGKLLANIMVNSGHIKVLGEKVYWYEEEIGCFLLKNKQDVQTMVMTWIEEHRGDADKITSRDLLEASRMLMINASIQVLDMDKAYNKPYVLCQNGVLELPSMKLLKKSHKYEFTSFIRANYDENAQGDTFKKYFNYVTNNDKKLQKRIQEIAGYILSNYSNIRTAFIFVGQKGTGKSTILDLLRVLFGEKDVSNVQLQDLENEYYTAKVLDHKINIASDASGAPIKGEISKFKALTSEHDVVSGRHPRMEVQEGRGRIKFLFGTNHHFTFQNLDTQDIEAFFDRTMYIPFNQFIKKRDYSFDEKIQLEYDYIFTWAMKGLKRLIENNFTFTSSKASEQCKLEAMTRYCPEEIFFKTRVETANQKVCISSRKLKEDYENFCLDHELTRNGNICRYLENKGYHKVRKRVDEEGKITSDTKINPTYVFQGLRLSNPNKDKMKERR